MAMNPMQRRTRNSFLLGFLIALVIMFLVVVFLLYKIKGLNEAKEALEAKQTEKLVAIQDLKSGQEILQKEFDEYFTYETVISDVPDEQIFDETDFNFYDVEGKIIKKVDQDDNPIYKKIQMRIDVPAGTIVTKNMVEEVDNVLTADVRTVEFTSVTLPAQLQEGEYIDIRYAIPDGQDYIVLSRKKVLQCNKTSIWLNLTEDELLTMNSAIVETYRNKGIKLYAVQYVEPGMQVAAIPTYPVKQEVKELIARDPNVVEEAKLGIEERYNRLGQGNERIYHIQTFLEDSVEDQTDAVSTGIRDEAKILQSEREEFLGGD